jgi:hypothetical protein
MGAFYGSVQVRSEDRSGVKAVAEEVARAIHASMLVGPVIDGWVGLYPFMNGQDERVGAAMAGRMDADVLHLIVHDDDVFAYWLYRGGELVDSFWSLPGYFGEQNGADQEAMTGDSEAFRPIVGDQAPRLVALLVRGEEQELSAIEQLEEFAKALKISNALTAYEYLKDGETEEIKKWKQFEEVPAERVVEAKQTARELRSEVERARKQLKADGLLLLHDERKGNERPHGCAIEGGFVVGWADHGADTVEFRQYGTPWDKARTPGIETSKHVTGLASDGAQKRVAISAGDRVHVFGASGDEWSRVADIPESDVALAVALSADGKILAHASRDEVIVTAIEGARPVCAVPQRSVQHLAFHPDGEWLAITNGRSFGLISLHSQKPWRELYVGGKKEVASHAWAVWSAMQGIDVEEVERRQRVEMDKMIKKLQKSGGKSKQPKMSDEDIRQFRESMEKDIQELKTRIAARKEGLAPDNPPQSQEMTLSLGFSRDGRWLWRGGDQEICVYEWEKVPRDPGSELSDPVWRIELPGDAQDHRKGNRVWAIAEEVGSPAIVFSGSGGSLYRLDLESGQLRELIKPPGEAWVIELEMSADGSVLGVTLGTRQFSEAARERGERTWAWEVWSYSRLRDIG